MLPPEGSDSHDEDPHSEDASGKDVSGRDVSGKDAPGAGGPGEEGSSGEDSAGEEPSGEEPSGEAPRKKASADRSPAEQGEAVEDTGDEGAPGDGSPGDSSPGDSSSGDSSSFEGGGPNGGAQAVECVNCGHGFTGNYCPSCGQEADSSVTVGDVAGGFARELVDIEGGFRAVVVGLTARPAATLRGYLRGARAGLISPGRYLLASVVILFVLKKGLTWTGLLRPASAVVRQAAPSAEEDPAQPAQKVTEVLTQAVQSQWFSIAVALVSSGLLALILFRLFGEELTSAAEALATSAFLVGHARVLMGGLLLLVVPSISVLTGRPAGQLVLSGIGLLVPVLYITVVAYSLDQRWRVLVKACLGAIWAVFESVLIIDMVAFGYAFWQVGPRLSMEETVAFAATGAPFSIPLLLHAVVELYYRLR